MKLCMDVSAPSNDEHDRPVTVAEHAVKRLDIRVARLGATAGMRVNPNPPEFFRLAAEIHLVLIELSNSDIIKCNERLCTVLLDKNEILDEQQVIGRRDSESTDLSWSKIPQEQQLRPGVWTEPQCGTALSPFAARSS